MTWLPSLRYGEHRWWLPLTATASSRWADIAIRYSCGDALGAGTAAQELLLNDPPSLIWCLCAWSADVGVQRRVSVSVDDLAVWLGDAGLESWFIGDALLGAPNATSSMHLDWRSLYSKNLREPPEHWSASAKRWFEVVGSSVPVAWSKTWPKLAVTGERGVSSLPPSDLPCDPASIPFALATLPVAELFRELDVLRSLRQHFRAAVETAKTEANYQCAYGLSHEINNPLSNIAGRAQTLLARPGMETHRKPLQAILDQTQRAFDMIADLMYVARPPKPSPRATLIVPWFQSIGDEYRAKCQARGVHLQWIVDRDVRSDALVNMDPHMLGDALRAVVRNACEAIEDGAEIWVQLNHDQDQWTLRVGDNGPGLSPAARQHAFDPYFSGREAGRGLGMGLCKARRIMERLGGKIVIEPTGPGCHVRIGWPTSPS